MDSGNTVDGGLQPLSNGSIENTLQSELERILQQQRNKQFINRERDLNIYRSGSAPPTVEGSLSAFGSLRNSEFGLINSRTSNNNGILTEDEVRSHPAYLSFYYSHEYMNPRLPPPFLSKEDWRVAQRFQAGGSSFDESGEWRKKMATNGHSSSLFSMQPGFPLQQAENDLMELRRASLQNPSRQGSAQLLDRNIDGLARMVGAGLGARRSCFSDILQEGLDQPTSLSSSMSRAASHGAFGNIVDSTAVVDRESLEGLRPSASTPGLVGIQTHGVNASHSFDSAVGSLSRVTTPETQAIGRSLGSGVAPMGSKVFSVERSGNGLGIQNVRSSSMTNLADMASSFSRLNLSGARHAEQDSLLKSKLQMEVDNRHDVLLSTPSNFDFSRHNTIVTNLHTLSTNDQINLLKKTASSANLHSKVHSAGNITSLSTLDYNGHVPGSYPVNLKSNSVYNNHLETALRSCRDGQSLDALVNQVGLELLSTNVDPRFMQSLQQNSDYSMDGVGGYGDPSQMRNFSNASHGDMEELRKAYLEKLRAQAQQKHGFFGSQPFGLGIPYTGKQLTSSSLTSLGSGNQPFENERITHFNSMMRSSMGGSGDSGHVDIVNNMEGRFPLSPYWMRSRTRLELLNL